MKKILITGHTSGVGLALVKLLAPIHGISVHGISRSKLSSREALIDHQVVVDMSDTSLVDYAMYDELVKNTRYDVIIQNAGDTNRNYLIDHSVDDILSLMNINLISPMIIHKHLEQLNHPQLFINVLSGSAVEDFRKLPVYATAKAGLLKFMHQLHKDYSDMTANGSNIGLKKIINLLPGPIDTKLCPNHYRTGSVPLLTPEEVAQHIVDHIHRTEFSNDHSILDIKI